MRATSPHQSSPAASLATASLAALALGVAALLAACDAPPPLTINYDLSKGPAQACPVENCGGIAVACNTVLSIRIVDPAAPAPLDPSEDGALVSVCQKISATSLCGLHQVRLPTDKQLPARRLAIQVALYNADDVTLPGGILDCPRTLRFDANNLAVPSEPHPAVAGQGYFSPGDSETVVKLGCNDLTVINTPTCRGDDRVQVTASVDDFDTGVVLPPSLAADLGLHIGEPKDGEPSFRLPFSTLTPLKYDRDSSSVTPAWNGELKLPLQEAQCVVVSDITSHAATSVSCQRLELSGRSLDIRGIRLSMDTFNVVLGALQLPRSTIPKKGIVIGMVVDGDGNPVKNVQVRPSSGTVKYLSEGRDQISGTATSSTGIFMSLDAPYKTSWSAANTSGGYGGLIEDYVTVIVLRPDAEQSGEAELLPADGF